MNKLILCEGKTDAILLSYYLGQVQQWTPCKRGPKGYQISVNEKAMESAYWYQRGSDYLLICAVGGKDNFGRFFTEKVCSAIKDAQVFSKVALVTDRDNREVEDIAKEVCQEFSPVITQAKQNLWIENQYNDGYGLEQSLSFLLLVIPFDQQGALETLLLNTIAEDPYDREIVARSIAFVEEIEPYAQRYIKRARLKLKARLGVTWAIQSPGKEFAFIDEQIRSVPWEKFHVLAECFSQLILI